MSGEKMMMKANVFKYRTLPPVLFMLVMCSLLFAACTNPFNQQTDASQKIPPGMGAFSLTIGEVNMRTIMPETGTAHFAVYKLEFYVSGTLNKTTDRTNTTLSDPVYLVTGAYQVRVTAYVDADKNKPAAYGTANITITTGSTASCTVNLEAIIDDDGSGNFTWDIDFPANVTEATMTITPRSAGGSAEQTFNLRTGIAPNAKIGSVALYSGYYNIIIHLKRPGVKEITHFEILHIYNNLDSNYEFNFSENYFQTTQYTITFDYNDGTTVNGTATVSHGDNLVDHGDPTREFNPVAGLYLVIPEQWVFEGWYTSANVKWNLDTPIIGDMTLTAMWSEPSGIEGVAANNIAAAITYVNAHAAGVYTLLIDSNVSAAPQSLSPNAKLVIKGLGAEWTISLSGNGSLFNVDEAELTIGENITLAGRAGNTAPLVYIQNGTFTMRQGSKITGNTSTGNTSAVMVESSTFYMEGGTITGNTAAGIEGCAVFIDSFFNMSGGSISGNTGELGDVHDCTGVTGKITLSQGAVIGKLSLASAIGKNPIAINTGWSGNIGALNMRGAAPDSGDGGDILNVIEFWEGRTLVQGSGGNQLTAADIAKITLGSFITTDGIVLPVPNHYIGATGNDIGKLLALYDDSYTKIYAFRVATGDMIIYIYEDLTLPVPVTIPANANGYTLTIMSWPEAGTRTITRGIQDTAASNGLFMVSNGAKLIFEDLIIDGNYKNSDDTINFTNNGASLVRVESGGALTLNSGAILENNRATNGGAVYLNGASNNTAALTMNAGSKISGNTASSYGGGVYATYGTFTMSGGEISGNTTSSTISSGGGVYATYGTFTMSGGEISGNTTSYSGGGVYVYSSSTFTMSGSAVISGNTASSSGGGVYDTGTMNMSGGEIRGNTASSGGGVYIDTSYSALNMSGGKITGNFITGANANGGGVFNNAGTFRVGGAAEIHGNTRTSDSSNNNAYLSASAYITIGTGAAATGNNIVVPVPAASMNIHVRTGRTDGVIVSSGANDGHIPYFTADDGDEIGYLGGQLIIGMNVSSEAIDFYEKVALYASATGDMVIEVTADLELPLSVMVPTPSDVNYTLTIKSGSGGTRTITRGAQDTGASGGLFTVSSNAKLIFEDLIINGKYKNSDDTINFASNAASLVRVNSGGALTLNSGTVLRNNRASDGGAVYLNGAYSTTATLTMNGGSKISGNTASSDGGGVYVYYGTFTMNGGEISGNTTSSTSSSGGGVYVYNSSTFTMNGGEISGNTTSYGGGVYIRDSGTMNMSSNAVISGNMATSAGGGNGGGVYISSYGGTLNMSGGEIRSNTASSTSTSGGNGGGVYISSYGGTLNMSGGKITDNSITGVNANGGGVYNGGTFRVGGAAEIHGNTRTSDSSSNNAYLTASTYIVLGTGTSATGNVLVPTTGMNIRVRTEREDGVIVNGGANAGHIQYFTADEAGKQITIFGVDMLRIQ